MVHAAAPHTELGGGCLSPPDDSMPGRGGRGQEEGRQQQAAAAAGGRANRPRRRSEGQSNCPSTADRWRPLSYCHPLPHILHHPPSVGAGERAGGAFSWKRRGTREKCMGTSTTKELGIRDRHRGSFLMSESLGPAAFVPRPVPSVWTVAEESQTTPRCCRVVSIVLHPLSKTK